METKTRFIVIAVAGTILGALLDAHGPIGALLYPPYAGPGAMSPTGGAMGALVGVMLITAVAFGIGLALLANGPRRFQAVVGGSKALGTWTWLAVVWSLVNWIPHDSLHEHIAPGDFASLAGIEWGFHATLVVAGLLMARFVYVAGAAGAARGSRSEARASDASVAH